MINPIRISDAQRPQDTMQPNGTEMGLGWHLVLRHQK
jgi:hypothetical protein